MITVSIEQIEKDIEAMEGKNVVLGPVDKLISPQSSGGDVYEAEIAI